MFQSLSSALALSLLVPLLAATLGFLWPLRGDIAAQWRGMSTGKKVGWIFIPILLGFLALGALFLTDQINVGDEFWRALGRLLLVCILVFLPGIIFALFIVARSTALLNSFIANLDRLGLLGWRVIGDDSVAYTMHPTAAHRKRGIESDESRQRRITSYFERFEALYGDLDAGFVKSLINATAKDSTTSRGSSVSPGFLSSYFIPIYLVTALCAIGWLASLPPLAVKDFPTALDSYVPRLTTVSAAFFGAYAFSLQLLVWRFMRRDLGPNAYVAFALRIVLTVIAAWILPIVLELSPLGSASEAQDEATVVILAFIIGVFPMILWQLIGGAVKKFPGVSLALPNLKKVLPLSDLDGLTVWHEARLQEEDIENVNNMANADVVDVMLSTRFPPHRIIEWIDQSILLTCIAGDTNEVTSLRRNELRKHSIVNATTVLLALRERHIPPTTQIRLSSDAGDTVNLLAWLAELADGLKANSNLPLVRTWKNIGMTTLVLSEKGQDL